MKLHHGLSIVLTAACLLLLMSCSKEPEITPEQAHHHGHEHDGHTASTLSLNQGEKWQTDVPLRQGMQSINDAAMSATTDFHHDALTKEDAAELAKHITGQVDYLINNCKLEPQADATLHVLIGDLLGGADVLSKQPLSSQGLPRIIQALQLYPDYFNHENWSGLSHEKN
ncbi:MAG TPA: hypothetical protein DD827_02640 [Gammaproteobacteria bacterium]|jgi:hypothetical protein|nr:hypothetical protein [Gammaproteobacteria bacterium]